MKLVHTLITTRFCIYLLGAILLIMISLPCTKKWYKEYKENRENKKKTEQILWKFKNMS
jgi:hypothetical protein